MSRCVNDINLNTFVMNSSILGEDSDTTFSFNIIGVHDTLLNFLICTENAALFQKLVHKCGFPMVNVGNNGYIAYIFAFGLHKIEFLSFYSFYINVFHSHKLSDFSVYHIFRRLQGVGMIFLIFLIFWF